MIDKINFTARVGFYSTLHKKPAQLAGRMDNISRLFEEKTKNSDSRLVVEADEGRKNDRFELYNYNYKEHLGSYVAPFSSVLAHLSDDEAANELSGILNTMEACMAEQE